jgi:hypothetical protein
MIIPTQEIASFPPRPPSPCPARRPRCNPTRAPVMTTFVRASEKRAATVPPSHPGTGLGIYFPASSFKILLLVNQITFVQCCGSMTFWCGSGGSGSIPLTDGSGSGSRRPKNMWIRWIRIQIRIRNTAFVRYSFFFLRTN